jgi:hypothetical protein
VTRLIFDAVPNPVAVLLLQDVQEPCRFIYSMVEVELVEEPALIPPLPPHHRAVSVADSDQTTESPFGRHLNAFIDSIDPSRT